jgi:hypothetical protein
MFAVIFEVQPKKERWDEYISNSPKNSSRSSTSFEGAGDIRHREVRIIRDYGMFERREAPQFYPEVIRQPTHLSK